MYADDVDEDSDFTESTTSKSQRTSKVSAVSETHRSPSQTKSSPTITTTSKSDDGVVVKGNLFIALVHRKAINKGDLNVQKGDVLKIHSTREDGWWIAENENGQRGMVPKNILKHCTGDVVKPQRAVQRIQAEVKLFRPQYNSQFFARSNYRMDKVILMIELFVTLRKPGSPLSHARSFFAELPLLNEAHQSLLKNGTRQIQMEASNAAFKDTPTITLSISDISQKQVGFCDMLPDVVVWNPSYLQLTAAYRVCLGHFTRTRADPTSADATFDPLLGLFPRLCDQPDMLDLLMALCVKKKLNFNMMNDAFVEQFSNLFVTSVFGIDQLASLPKYDLWDEPSLKRREEMLTTFLTTLLISNQNPLKYQTEMKIRPLDIHKFAVDLCGPHAID
ncbi:hypothetical protein QR680_000144 [Steinernema hermaphroditum]|uniref:SH3 domain-containing protein n=1 Tax=Steinernema hermaphroditum TaxID=289476 RepID=A0AA39GTR5_9BILA|nr:hypothetical protein QR680_000144 [Steinernema hermaphroditum]